MLASVLTNVPTGVGTALAYSMLIVVASLLITGPVIVYHYMKKFKKMQGHPEPLPAPSA